MSQKTPLWKKTLISVIALIALLAALALAMIWYIGAWNILFPSSDHDTVAPSIH